MTERRQILLHAGFHKTGTSSMQHFLWANRERLAPEADVLLLRHLQPVAKLCMGYARQRNPLLLADLAPALDTVLAEHPPGAGRHLVLSCEGLSGHLPGWPGVADYSAAPETIGFIAGWLAARFPHAELSVVLTTRDAEGWLYSAYRHHLLGQRLTLDWSDFATRMQGAADLIAAAVAIAEAVAETAPAAQVLTLPLEDAIRHPLGPGGALIEGLALSAPLRASLRAVGHGNRGPDKALWSQFLALNRRAMPDSALAKAKRDLAEAAGLGGWRPVKPHRKGTP
ncbi:MAG: hypothetical protein GC146_10215 [Limimaricola sp.]|uniref:hypothetical protein n=1 Tax=Limimaricola sp. TaxID=2211665 RepID=UPI001D5D373D|nr:hypothetical protein [Limimaricola sp.]MBI1417583.1 hypothetical protein [Limimaricola sp.]